MKSWIELLGGTNVELNQGGKITTTMMVGLQGAGKTTTAGKLALKVKKTMKKKPLLIAAGCLSSCCCSTT